jgi:hypothetical protein
VVVCMNRAKAVGKYHQYFGISYQMNWNILDKHCTNPQVLFFPPNGMAKTTYVHFHLQSKSRYCLETNL